MQVDDRLLLQRSSQHNKTAGNSNAFSRKRVVSLILIKNEPASPAIQFLKSSNAGVGISVVRNVPEIELLTSSGDVEDVIISLAQP